MYDCINVYFTISQNLNEILLGYTPLPITLSQYYFWLVYNYLLLPSIFHEKKDENMCKLL